MSTFKDIEKPEADLWEAADNLRANSKPTSSDYFMPVLGIIFLRHAANRFEAANEQIAQVKRDGGMPRRGVIDALATLRATNERPRAAREVLLPRPMSGEIAV